MLRMDARREGVGVLSAGAATGVSSSLRHGRAAETPKPMTFGGGLGVADALIASLSRCDTLRRTPPQAPPGRESGGDLSAKSRRP
eukprot:1083665-Prorocentrum_minimum.AAC.1